MTAWPRNWPRPGRSRRLVPALADRLEEWRKGGFHVVLVCKSRHRCERLARLLQEENLAVEVNFTPAWEPGSRVEITVGELSGGFRMLSRGLIVLTEDEALGFPPEGRRRKESRTPQDLTSLATSRKAITSSTWTTGSASTGAW